MKCTIHNKANSTQSFEWIEDKFNHILDLEGLSIPTFVPIEGCRTRYPFGEEKNGRWSDNEGLPER